MLRGIDHIVIAVEDMHSAAAQYRELGFQVVEGGKHPIGSYNNLIGFKDGSYIELLSFYEETPEHFWWDALYIRGGGLIDFCMQTDDIQADYAYFKARHVDMGDLVGLSRVRPDGYKLSWANNEVHDQYQGLVPFLIEDQTPRDERVPKDIDHVNGVNGIHTITLATQDLPRVRSIFDELPGITLQEVRREDLQAHGVIYSVGPHFLEYLTPDDETSPLQIHINENRPIPYSITLTTSGEAKEYTPEETLGVRMKLITAS